MSKKKIIKKLEKIAEKHGAELLAEVVTGIYLNGDVTTNGNAPACPLGQVWNPIIKRCVDDLG